MSTNHARILMVFKAVAAILLILALAPLAHANDKNEELITAAKQGRLEEVKRLLEEGADINTRDELGGTPLVRAAGAGRLEIVKVLLKHGADIDAKDNFHRSVVMWACGNRHWEVARFLKDRGAKVTLVVAAALGDLQEVQRLLSDGANVNAKEFDRQPLMAAIDRGHLKVAKLLLDNGAEVNGKVGYFQTPLMRAAENGQPDAVKLLLDRGAAVNANNRVGWTALMYAAQSGHPEVVRLLLDKSAHVNARKDGRTALTYAAAAGHSEVVRLLLDKSADVYVRDKQDRAPLIEALRRGDLATAKGLFDKKTERKLPTIDLFDLMSLYMIPASASYTVLPWAAVTQQNSPIEWTTDGTEPDQATEEHTREGEAVVTLNGGPLSELGEEPTPSIWKISLIGDSKGVHEIEISCNTTGGCVDLERELRNRGISFELYMCDPESWASYNEQIYAIKTVNRKKAWLYYSRSSGSAGCAGDFILFFNKEDADQSDRGLNLDTDCGHRGAADE